ncbi:MAG: restriction endonuclease [Bacteroidetes bacterium]|nr:restriction endonuclease [Bacteroidota bacterium]
MSNPILSILVRKNTGELVPFEEKKLRSALHRSGASDEEIDDILREVSDSLYDGISTRKIYDISYRILARRSQRAAGRFRLKKAILALGPSGYPFEHFVAKLFEYDGFQTSTGRLIQGRCVTHEVDVLAEKPDKTLMAECKYHHVESRKNDVKTSLYVHSRFEDIKAEWMNDPSNKGKIFEAFLITNTRFTEDAVQYAKCTGLHLISWDYPAGNSLKERIDRSGFHPVTSLRSLQKKEIQALLEKGIVLCRQIPENPAILEEIGLSTSRAGKTLKEAGELSGRVTE